MPETTEQTQTPAVPEQQATPEGGKTESVTLTQAKLEAMLTAANVKGREEAKSQFTGKISQQGKENADLRRDLEAAGMSQEERDRIYAADSWRTQAVDARIKAEGLPLSAKRVLMAARTVEDFEAAIGELKEDFKGFDARAFVAAQTGSAGEPSQRPKSPADATLVTLGGARVSVAAMPTTFDPRGGHVRQMIEAQQKAAKG